MNKLEELRQGYLATRIDDEAVEKAWQELSSRLPEQQRFHYSQFMNRYAIATLCLFLIVSGLFGVAQTAQPDTPLYSVKVFSDQVVAKVTGKHNILIEKRADEVIKAAEKKSPSELQPATEAYTKTLNEANNAGSKSAEAKESLHKTLDAAKQKLRSVTPANSQSQKLIQDSIKATEQTKEEVKGAKDTQSEKGKSEDHRQNENNSNAQEQKNK